MDWECFSSFQTACLCKVVQNKNHKYISFYSASCALKQPYIVFGVRIVVKNNTDRNSYGETEKDIEVTTKQLFRNIFWLLAPNVFSNVRLIKLSDGLFGGSIKRLTWYKFFFGGTELCSSSLELCVLAAILLQIQIFWDVTGSQGGVKITEDLKIWIFIPLQSLQSILLTYVLSYS
jgi:hypothetical protein